jgi:tRNA threonylcarbamoyladenosine biosynthesis protein TsaE
MKSKSESSQMSWQKIVQSPQQTVNLASEFSRILVPGDLVAFYGQLGSGKTFFIKALCNSLGIQKEATSPSFTIINEYEASGSLLIYHFDFYRIETETELINLGLDEFFYNDYICLIEWADKIEKLLPPRRWEIRLDFVSNQPDSREITIQKIV